jgi:hypothetical protein
MDTTALSPPTVTALPGATAAAVAWRSRGQLHVTVIAKATFAFAPEAAMPRAEPQEIFVAEVHHGAHAPTTVRFASDCAPHLERADVVFTGYAHAPHGTVVQTMPVRITIFDGAQVLLDKALRVQGASPFQRMPIVYERAAGGADGQENPIGVATNAATIVDPRDPSQPAGFGPIARAWPARRRLLGDTPSSALEGAILEIPDGFDWSYFQSAPPDQRIGYLRGGEVIVLQGLHPAVPQLRTRLPEARGLARIHGLSAFGVAEGKPLGLQVDTLILDGEAERCTLVFRGSFPVPGEGALAAARIVAGVELPGAPLVWPPTPRTPGLAGGTARWAATTVELPDDAAGAPPQPATPFRPGLAPEAIARGTSAPAPRQETGTLALGPEQPEPIVAPPPGVVTSSQTLALGPAQDELVSRQPAMPFQPAPPGAAPPMRSAESTSVRERLTSGTVDLSPEVEARLASQGVLPFSPPMDANAHESIPTNDAEVAPESPDSPAPAPAALPDEPASTAPAPPASAAEPAEPPAAPPPREKPRPPGGRMPPTASTALKASLYKRFDRE